MGSSDASQARDRKHSQYPQYPQEKLALQAEIEPAVQEAESGSSPEAETIQQLEQTLLKTRKRFESFISAAGHELRTPLTTIKGNAQLALRRLEKLRRKVGQQEQIDASTLGADLERLQQPLDYIVYRVNEQDKMISDLLDVSRVQSGKISIIMRPCNLVQIVQNAVQNTHEAAMDRIIDLTVPEEESQMAIHADPERVEQALNALLSNAMKYSMPDRPVKVMLAIEEREASRVAQVQVQDYGAGIPADELENIWDISYRVKGIEVQDGSSVGLGLGLFLCRALIERQQGAVGVHSVPGDGSIFWFTLPLAQEES
jgi:signal transduction histidine kinase